MWSEIFKRYISILLIGIIIKELHYEADGDMDKGLIMSRLLNRLMPGYHPYMLFILSIAMLLDTYHTFTLFSSAYMLRIFKFQEQALLKLKPYQEVIIIILLNLLLAPASILIHSILMIIILQLWDDLLDLKHDEIYGYFNYAIKFGRIEVALTICILLIGGFMISWINTLIVLPAIFLINYLYSI